MNAPPFPDTNRQLLQLYRQNPAIRVIFQAAARLNTAAMETTILEVLEESLVHSDMVIDRNEAVSAMKDIAFAGCGEFVIGRRGSETRIVWNRDPKPLGLLLERYSKTESPPISGSTDGSHAHAPTSEGNVSLPISESFHVSYPLRLDFKVEFCLPPNLTHREATRLANFIKTLPFDAEAAEPKNPTQEGGD